MRSLKFAFALLALSLCSAAVSALQIKALEKEDDSRTHLELATGETDPETGIYYRKDNLWWLKEKTRRQQEFDRELKMQSLLNMTDEQYREFKHRQDFSKLLTLAWKDWEAVHETNFPGNSDPSLLSFPLSKYESVRNPTVSFLNPTSILSQEIEEGRERSDSEKSPGEREVEKRISDMFSGKSRLLPTEDMQRATSRSIQMTNTPDLPPTTFVYFGSGNPMRRLIGLKNSYYHSVFKITSLDDPGIHDCYTTGDLFVLSGRATPSDEEWFRSRRLRYVIQSDFSPKTQDAEYIRAAAMTVRPFVASQFVIFSGLPYEKGSINSRAELLRMGLTWKPKEWHAVSQEIASAAGSIPIATATKRGLINELETGNKDVLFIIAHSDSKSIFLPGLQGGKISLHELDSIKREVAPQRVIVLLACKTGSINGRTQSIAETLLKNRLAAVVFASEGSVDATELGTMLRTLSTSSLAKSFADFRAIVRLQKLELGAPEAEGSDGL
jgi:hypothetical protein